MDAQANANEGFLGADGFFDDGYNFTANDDFMGADGDTMPAAAPTSQPYIIQVANTGSAVSSFTSSRIALMSHPPSPRSPRARQPHGQRGVGLGWRTARSPSG